MEQALRAIASARRRAMLELVWGGGLRILAPFVHHNVQRDLERLRDVLES